MTTRTVKLRVLGQDAASGVLNGIGGSLSGLGSVAGGIATGGLLLVGAALAGVVGGAGLAVSKIADLTQEAAAVENTAITFGRLTEGIGGAVSVTADLQAATRGMVQDSDLWFASNKFLTMGITETAEETAQLAEMSTQLGLAMGEDATASMENFALMMANQSIPRLDSFGISSSAVRDRILELTEASADMTREEAFKIAVLEEGAVAMARVGEQGDTAAAANARWLASIANIKLSVGQAFIPVLETLQETFQPIIDYYGPKLVEWAEVAADWLGQKLPDAIAWTGNKLGDLRDGFLYLKDVFDEGGFAGLFNEIVEGSPFIQDLLARLEPLREWFVVNWPIIQAAVVTAWTVIQDIIASVVAVIVEDVWPSLQEAFVTIEETMAELGVDWGDVWAAIGTAVGLVAAAIGAILVFLVGVIVGIVNAIAKTIAHLMKVFQEMKDNFLQVVEGIVGMFAGAWAILKGIFTGDSELIKQGWKTWIEGLANLWGGFLKGIWSGIKLVFGTILVFVGGFIEGIVNFFRNLYDRLVGHSIVTDIVNGIKNAFRDMRDSVTGFVDTLKRNIEGGFDGIKRAMQWVIDKIGNLRSAFGDLGGILPDWLKPDSPTPFELGLLGINKAISAMPPLSFGTSAMAMAGAGGSAGGNTTIQINFGRDSVRSDEDIREITTQIQRLSELQGIRERIA